MADPAGPLQNPQERLLADRTLTTTHLRHVVDTGDGVCGDCLWCEENADSDCIVPDDQKCVWCGHCLGNHS